MLLGKETSAFRRNLLHISSALKTDAGYSIETVAVKSTQHGNQYSTPANKESVLVWGVLSSE
jgi:hypothetical protein